MRRVLILGAVLAASIAPARAQLKPLSIDEMRAAAETGVPPLITQQDARMFANCGVPGIVPQDPVELNRAMGEAKATGVNIQVVWIRHHLTAIADCLARPGNH